MIKNSCVPPENSERLVKIGKSCEGGQGTVLSERTVDAATCSPQVGLICGNIQFEKQSNQRTWSYLSVCSNNIVSLRGLSKRLSMRRN